MERNDIVVLENLQQEDDQPRYLVVLAKEIENHAADGSSYDYSLENNDSECEYDMMKAIEKKFGINTAELSLYGEDNELEACIGSEISDELLAKINDFAKTWRKENEWFDSPTYWNYFDGSNWKSELLHSEEECANDNRQYTICSTAMTRPQRRLSQHTTEPRMFQDNGKTAILPSLMKKLGMRLDSLNGADTQVWQTFIKFITHQPSTTR